MAHGVVLVTVTTRSLLTIQEAKLSLG